MSDIMKDNAELIAAVVIATGERRLSVSVSESGPVGVYDLLGSDDVPNEPAVTFKQRTSRCMELTNYALLWGSAPPACRLIHGSMHGPFKDNERIRHAWLALRVTMPGGGYTDLIWEPATALWHLKREWYVYARAWEEREYTRRQAQELTLGHGHYGAWHESRYP